MSPVPNPKFSYLSTNELAELELDGIYATRQQMVEAERDKDRDAAAREKREAMRARERDKRID